MTHAVNPFHPDLQRAARLFPTLTMSRPMLGVMRVLTRLQRSPRAPGNLAVEDVWVPGPPGAPSVRVRTYRARAVQGPTPALLWIHGGGYVIGRPEMESPGTRALSRMYTVVYNPGTTRGASFGGHTPLHDR